MKIGFILKDIGLNEVDMRNPLKGNPGIGGSEYLFLLLMQYLSLKSKYDVICYHFSDNILSDAITDNHVKTVFDALEASERDDVDYLIYQINWGEQFYIELAKTNVNAIAWAHCYIDKKELKLMSETKNVVRVVCVGKEQYDTYIDHPIINKMTYIYNMVPMENNEYRVINENIVTFVGSLVKGKGFHILAKAWPKIKRKIPDAKLYVIGTGKLYDRTCKLGKYGIAEESYENSFMKYLSDTEGNIRKDVFFLGILGSDKTSIFKKTKVGVINPSAKTETFGLSAVEMSAYGIPIATKGKYGLYDTVINEKTGLLHHFESDFANNIIRLLRDDELNMRLGIEGKKFVNNSFNPEIIVSDWEHLFEDLKNGIENTHITVKNHFFNDFKFLRMINRFLRNTLKIKLIPPICEIKRTY